MSSRVTLSLSSFEWCAYFLVISSPLFRGYPSHMRPFFAEAAVMMPSSIVHVPIENTPELLFRVAGMPPVFPQKQKPSFRRVVEVVR